MFTTRCLALRKALASRRHLSRSTRGLSSTSCARCAAIARRRAAAAAASVERALARCASPAASAEEAPPPLLRRALQRTGPRARPAMPAARLLAPPATSRLHSRNCSCDPRSSSGFLAHRSKIRITPFTRARTSQRQAAATGQPNSINTTQKNTISITKNAALHLYTQTTNSDVNKSLKLNFSMYRVLL